MAIRLNRRLVENGNKLPVCRRLTQWKSGVIRASGHSEEQVSEIVLISRQYRAALPKAQKLLPVATGTYLGT